MKKIKINISLKRFLLTVASICLIVFVTLAQDYQFSQMKFTPLAVNPSSVGLAGRYNAIAIYRQQWQSVSDPFTTVGASFDMKFGASRKGGFLAAGINFYHDIAGDLKMTTSDIDLCVAYHLPVGRESTLGLGIQAGYGLRGLGSTKGLYASQYNGTTLDPNLPSGESFGSKSFGHVDLGSGIVFSHKGLRHGTFSATGYDLRVGFATYHLTRPKYSYLANSEEDLAMRFSGFVESEFTFRHSKFSIMPAVYYQRQKSTQDILFGTYIRYMVIPPSYKTSLVSGFSIAYGPFYRFGDAFVNKLLIDYNGYAIGIAYDVNLSSLTRASKGRGGIEFMFRWHLIDAHRTRARIH